MSLVIALALCAQTLVTSRTVGGSGSDTPYAMATDSQGFVYVTGITNSPDFPMSGGATQSGLFLIEMNPGLNQQVFGAIIGRADTAHIALDAANNIYLSGVTSSAEFPTTPGAYQRTLSSKSAGFLVKISGADHSLLYSTFLNGLQPSAIAIDPGGNAVIAGSAPATVACTKPMPILGTWSEALHAFVAEANTDGSALRFTKILSGSCGEDARAVAVDSSGSIYFGGATYSPDFPVTTDAMLDAIPGNTGGFLTKLTPDGQLVYSTFFGGGPNNSINAILPDAQGNLYLGGLTQAPATAGAYQPFGLAGCPPIINIGPGSDNSAEQNFGFVARMALSSKSPSFLARIGASCYNAVNTMAVDRDGNLWVTGSTGSNDFPTRAPIADLGLSAQGAGAFVAELDPTGSTLLFSSQTASAGMLTAGRQAPASVYLAEGMPQASKAGKAAVFVAALNANQHPPIALDSLQRFGQQPVVPFFLPQAIAPGQVVRLEGRGIGPATTLAAPQSQNLQKILGGVQVTFNGISAAIASVQANEIVCVAPFELAPSGEVDVQVTNGDQASNILAIGAAPQSMDLIAVVNDDWSVNTAANPAKVGSLVTIFLTGVGQTIPAGADGAIQTIASTAPQITPSFSVNGQLVTPAFFGGAVGQVAGVMQINCFAVPPSVNSPSPYFQIGGGANSSGQPVYGSIYVIQ